VTLPPPALEFCTRHPDVPTGRHCTRCDRAACNDCLVQADVGSHCVDCVRRARPSRQERARYWNAAQPILATKALVVINLVVYIWVISGRDVATGAGVISGREFDLGLSKIFIDNGEWYRIITSGFLHFSIFHIAMNMLLLWHLGQQLEPILDRTRFLLLYFSAMFGGAAGALLIQPDGLTGGASGAVFGLMAALAVAYQRRGINPMDTGIGALLVINLLITFIIPGISVGGHLGGALTGAAMGYIMLAPRRAQDSALMHYVAPIGAMVLSVMLIIALP
jgi:membrane associated rhomboid family serine protease